ncbi:MAG: hypothetical protein M3Q96_03300, partial [Pseudomonadota bacterium]|nr:hypothetical protein [Pseudomonadota bacterium]
LGTIGAESGPNMLLAMAMKNPALASAAIGVPTGAASFADARRDGRALIPAAAEGLATGAIETALGQTPFELAATPGKRLLSIPAEGLAEGMTEIGQTNIQDQFRGTETPVMEQLLGGLDAALIGSGMQAGPILADVLRTGMAPPAPTTTEELRATVLDPATPQEVRLATALELMNRGEAMDVAPMATPAAEDVTGTVAPELAQVMAGGVQLPPQQSAAMENISGQAEEQEGTRQEDGEGPIGGPQRDAGQAQAVEQGQAVSDPLAPRIPEAPVLPADATRAQLISEYQAAITPGEKAYAAGKIAAFDAVEQERGRLDTPTQQAGIDQGAVAGAAGPDVAGGTGQAGAALPPSASRVAPGTPATQAADSALTRSLVANERRTAAAEGRAPRPVAPVTGTREVLPDSGNNEGGAGLSRAISQTFGLKTVFFESSDPRWDGYNALTRVKGAEDTIFISSKSTSP